MPMINPQRATRESIAVDRIRDAHGEWHLVAEYRPTSHGWDLAIGWPEGMEGPGNPAVIATMPLVEYLSDTRLRDVVLPIGVSTVKRLRRDLGLRWDWDAWWSARADDLATMTLHDFASKHGCSTGAASQRRAVICSPPGEV